MRRKENGVGRSVEEGAQTCDSPWRKRVWKKTFRFPSFFCRFAFPTDICPFPLVFCYMSRESFPTKTNRLLRGRRFAAANAPRTPVRRRTVRDNGEARKERDKPFTGEFSGISLFPRMTTARMSVFYKFPFLFRSHRKRIKNGKGYHVRGEQRRMRTWQGVFQNGDLRARAELSTVAPRFGANRSEESCSRRALHNDTQTQLPAQDFAEKRHSNAVVRSTAQIIFVRLPFGTPDERKNPQARHLFPLGAHTFNGIRCPTSTRKR